MLENTEELDTPEGGVPATDLANDPAVKALIDAAEKRVLAEVKGKLDNAYNQRDQFKGRVDELEKAQRDAEIAALKAQGKLEEALQRELQEARDEAKTARESLTKATRDTEIQRELARHNPKGSRAAEQAVRLLADEMVYDNGTWVHKSGLTINAAVDKFAEDPENGFLFKGRQNSGNGDPVPKPSATPTGSLFAMSQAEVLKLAEQGKLPV